MRAPVSLAAAHLGRTVADFMARFPEVSVELTLSDRFADPTEEGFDVALRIAGLPVAARRTEVRVRPQAPQVRHLQSRPDAGRVAFSGVGGSVCSNNAVVLREFVNFLARSFAADSQWQIGPRPAPGLEPESSLRKIPAPAA